MKSLFLALSLSLISLLSFAQKKRILIIATNVDTAFYVANGSDLRDIGFAYAEFKKAGYEVDILTPEGGKAGLFLKGDTTPELKKIARSKEFREKIKNTLMPAQIRPINYAGVYFPGGYGLYADVVNHKGFHTITMMIYEDGGVIGASGEGCAALVHIRRKGPAFVTGKTMTCMPSWAQLDVKETKSGDLLPFNTENELKKRQAKLILCTRKAKDKPETTCVVDEDGRLVTAAFSELSKWTASTMITRIAATQKPEAPSPASGQ